MAAHPADDDNQGLHFHTHHAPINMGMVSSPHGPETGDSHAHFPLAHNPENEKAIFSYLLHPDDSYNEAGEYWADLSVLKRISFVNNVDNAEAKKELKQIGAMTKKDPLSPVSWYFRNAVLPGAGLGLEG